MNKKVSNAGLLAISSDLEIHQLLNSNGALFSIIIPMNLPTFGVCAGRRNRK